MGSLLEVKNLSKIFKEVRAVNDLSFTVNSGDVYGFLGQNGAGKSTTLRMLLKLIQPTSGEIYFSGKNIMNDGNAMLRETGAVIEKPDLYKFLSAYDNLSIFAKLSGIKPTRALIMDQLHTVGLAERAQSKVKTFSQGMKQRLGIAVALVHSPKLVILDEPINGLDPQGIADMRNLILNLSREEGKTVIISSHLLSEIEIVANRMIIIHKGKKIAEGNVAELLDPSHTILDIDTTNNPAAAAILLKSSWAPQINDTTDQIRMRMNRNDIPALVSFLQENNISLLALQPRHSLEDYFLSLTNRETNAEPFTN
ncbi:MAG: ABC transporter ATP-binding protein [Ferruginibacter sp.]